VVLFRIERDGGYSNTVTNKNTTCDGWGVSVSTVTSGSFYLVAISARFGNDYGERSVSCSERFGRGRVTDYQRVGLNRTSNRSDVL
jgi:hypothetical protein